MKFDPFEIIGIPIMWAMVVASRHMESEGLAAIHYVDRFAA